MKLEENKYFKYRDNQLFCENISIEEILKEIDTPFYLYSFNSMRDRYRSFEKAFPPDSDHLICYAIKANSNLSIIKTITAEGGAEIVSKGELFQAIKAGVDPGRIIFSGVGKTGEEIKSALKAKILGINLESLEEMEMVENLATKFQISAPISFRVNPDIDPKTAPYISTGLKENKFGLSFSKAEDGYKRAHESEHLEIVGVHMHIGSQITEISPVENAVQKVIDFVKHLENLGINLRFIDVGGGLGIDYEDNHKPPSVGEYVQIVCSAVNGLDSKPKIIVEPGRALVGEAGVLITKVVNVKDDRGKVFVVVDVGMNDFIRPSLYKAYHRITPIRKHDREEAVVDIVGPICESSDFFGLDRKIERVRFGEPLAILNAGAYGYSMSSNYNSRPRIAEIMVRDDQFYLIRKREKVEDLYRNEQFPPYLNDDDS